MVSSARGGQVLRVSDSPKKRKRRKELGHHILGLLLGPRAEKRRMNHCAELRVA
jgi:hypothetical protein